MSADDLALALLRPHFDAVRDVFSEWKTPDGNALRKAKSVDLIVTEAAGGGRHYARTITTGKYMEIAPDAVDLELDTLVAIIAHEFGHAVDFLYPGCFTWPTHASKQGASIWVGEGAARRAAAYRAILGNPSARSRHKDDDIVCAVNWMAAWERRSADQVEWAADGICELVTGRKVRYAGAERLQSFDRGGPRPAGLR